MSATRKATSKKVKALITGAEYATKGAGAMSIALNALGLCIFISNPIALAIAGAAGVIFCCVGGCYEWHQADDPLEHQQNNGRMYRAQETQTYYSEHTLFSSSSVQSPGHMTMDESIEQTMELKSVPLR